MLSSSFKAPRLCETFLRFLLVGTFDGKFYSPKHYVSCVFSREFILMVSLVFLLPPPSTQRRFSISSSSCQRIAAFAATPLRPHVSITLLLDQGRNVVLRQGNEGNKVLFISKSISGRIIQPAEWGSNCQTINFPRNWRMPIRHSISSQMIITRRVLRHPCRS